MEQQEDNFFTDLHRFIEKSEFLEFNPEKKVLFKPLFSLAGPYTVLNNWSKKSSQILNFGNYDDPKHAIEASEDMSLVLPVLCANIAKDIFGHEYPYCEMHASFQQYSLNRMINTARLASTYLNKFEKHDYRNKRDLTDFFTYLTLTRDNGLLLGAQLLGYDQIVSTGDQLIKLQQRLNQ